MIFEIGDGYVYKKIVSPARMYFIRQKVAAKFMIAILILLISVRKTYGNRIAQTC